MPMLEVIHTTRTPSSREQKQAFVHEAIEIFREVLGTPDGRLRVVFYPIAWEDSMAGLLDENPIENEDES